MDLHLCNYCRRPAELICQRCRDRYCSQKCQDIDWPQHRLFCFPMPYTLMRPLPDTTLVKSESVDEGLRPPSPLSKFRHLKLASEHVTDNTSKSNGSVKADLPHKTPSDDRSSKADHQPLAGNKENVPNGSAKDNGPSPIKVPSADVQQEVKSSIKPAYYKTDIDAASIRKPGPLSQVVPKQIPVQPSSAQQPKQTIQEPKQVKVEPPKQVKVEPPKQQNVEPPKQVKVEPPKQQNVEPPKQVKVEPPKQVNVEPPKQVKVDPPKESESSLSPVEPPKIGPWMQPFPMAENVFVEVSVQYVASDGIAWVSLATKDQDNTNLLRKCNKVVSVASTPSRSDIHVNSLFLVPFESVYYRGVVLKPVTANDTVAVRLVDFGNDVDLPIEQLKTAIPSVSEVNAYAFPIKFKKPRNAEIGNLVKVKKVSTEGDVITVIVDGEADVNIITMKDIDVLPIPEGINQSLTCSDFSNVGKGYVSVSVSDAKAIQYITNMGPIMSKYCAGTTKEYCPQVNELCLAEFEDEGWFRALTLKVIEPNKFEIMFIDYGNIITANSSNIREMTDEFTHPCSMNECYIKDFPKAPTKDDITKAAIYFDANPAFRADVEKKGDRYFITVKF